MTPHSPPRNWSGAMLMRPPLVCVTDVVVAHEALYRSSGNVIVVVPV
ncbi:MAG TPA: hypothetical protein VKB50_22195 [Vicinamibacterales bacterium]|nr:hypothetical protein [Vicinamibacterales bacterium]